jgi:hypothetical protein
MVAGGKSGQGIVGTAMPEGEPHPGFLPGSSDSLDLVGYPTGVLSVTLRKELG